MRKVRVWDSLETRFWKMTNVGDVDVCWEWKGCRTKKGYGQIGEGGGGAILRANRVSWELHNGPIPPSMFVLHSCDNPGCVNPTHLSLGSAADNTADMKRKGRGVKLFQTGIARGKGEKHPRAKLSDKDVQVIRIAGKRGLTAQQLAAHYKMHVSYIRRILRGMFR